MKDNNLAKYLSIFVAFVALVGAILFIRVFMEDVDALESDAAIQASVVNPIVFFSAGLLYAAVAIAIVLSLWSVIKNPQNIKKKGIGLGLGDGGWAISYSITDRNEVLNTQGHVLEVSDAGTANNQWGGTGSGCSRALGGGARLFFG